LPPAEQTQCAETFKLADPSAFYCLEAAPLDGSNSLWHELKLPQLTSTLANGI